MKLIKKFQDPSDPLFGRYYMPEEQNNYMNLLDNNYLTDNIYFDTQGTAYVGRKGSNTPKVNNTPKIDPNHQKLWVKAKPIYNYLRSQNIPKNIALAAVANIALESSVDPNAFNGQYSGYLQTGKELTQYIKDNYKGFGHNHQINFLMDVLNKRNFNFGETTKNKMHSRWDRELNTIVKKFHNSAQKNPNLGDLAEAWGRFIEGAITNGVVQSARERRAIARSFGLLAGK